MSGQSFSYDARFFNYVPMRAKTLRYAFKVGRAALRVRVRQPAYRTRLPVWKAAPLPQTQTDGDVALTLNALTIERFSKFTL